MLEPTIILFGYLVRARARFGGGKPRCARPAHAHPTRAHVTCPSANTLTSALLVCRCCGSSPRARRIPCRAQVAFFLVLVCFNWKLTPGLGVALLFMQAGYWGWNIGRNFNVLAIF
eukprot:4425265-Pleurochrysis_carterae.AAC.2